MRLDPVILLAQDAALAAAGTDDLVRAEYAGIPARNKRALVLHLRKASWRAQRAADFLEHQLELEATP